MPRLFVFGPGARRIRLVKGGIPVLLTTTICPGVVVASQPDGTGSAIPRVAGCLWPSMDGWFTVCLPGCLTVGALDAIGRTDLAVVVVFAYCEQVNQQRLDTASFVLAWAQRAADHRSSHGKHWDRWRDGSLELVRQRQQGLGIFRACSANQA